MLKNGNRYKKHYPGRLVINFEDDIEEPLASPESKSQPAPAQPDDGHGQDLCFMSFGSGSSGNCAYLGSPRSGLLIDAGVDPLVVFKRLAANGIRPDMVKGIILTHDHQDHVRYVYRFVRQYRHIGIYCTPRLLKGMLRRHNISRRVQDYQKNIFKEFPFHLAGMEITAFNTSHDGTDNMGFFIRSGEAAFVVATDMGVITPEAERYMQQATCLMIESNYDSEMLIHGHYSEMLKHRVASSTGHLDNVVAARFVASHYTPALKYVFLCHLSNDNNTPDIALNTMREALQMLRLTVGDASYAADQRDRDVQLYALPRYDASPWFVIN